MFLLSNQKLNQNNLEPVSFWIQSFNPFRIDFFGTLNGNIILLLNLTCPDLSTKVKSRSSTLILSIVLLSNFIWFKFSTFIKVQVWCYVSIKLVIFVHMAYLLLVQYLTTKCPYSYLTISKGECESLGFQDRCFQPLSHLSVS